MEWKSMCLGTQKLSVECDTKWRHCLGGQRQCFIASLLCLTLLTSITVSQWSVSWRRSLVKSWSKGSLPEPWRAQPLESTGVMALFPMEHPALNYWELSYGPPTLQQQKVDLDYSFLMKNTEHKRILQPLFGRGWGAWWCMFNFFLFSWNVVITFCIWRF